MWKIFFHSSSIIFLFFYLLYYLYSTEFYNKYRSSIRLFTLVSVLLILYLPEMIETLIQIGVVKGKYILYASGGTFTGHLQKSAFVYRIIILCYLYNHSKCSSFPQKRIGLFFWQIAIYDIMFCFIGSLVIYLSRISFYTFII